MTLYQIIRRLETFSLTLPNVRTASDGDVYAGLNDNPELKYGVFFITQNSHQELEDMDRYGLTLFYIDRLDDTLEDNRLQIQSIGKEIISVILRDFCEEYDIDLPTINYTPFTQKFKDETAGVYAQIMLEVIKGVCADDFSDIISIYQTKTIDIENNGQYIVLPDSSYSALEKVIVNVDVACSGCTEEELQEMYESGWTDGYSEGLADCTGSTGYDEGFEDGQAAQKALLSSITITHNGEYFQENGYSAITVNVPQSGGGDFQEGFESGITYQKSLLSSTAFTQNGDYTRTNGWSAITIDVSGYTQEDLDNAYWRGYADGLEDCGSHSGDTGETGDYLTIEALENGSLYWCYHNFYPQDPDYILTIEYKKNNDNWTSVTSSSSGTLITNVVTGDVVKFRGNNASYSKGRFVENGYITQTNYFGGNIACNVYGNIMSLVNSTGFETAITLTEDATFDSLFGGGWSKQLNIISIANLKLPATTLTNYCYAHLFSSMPNITTAPSLPATTLTTECYRSMFAGCSNLSSTPALPATTLANGCYYSMFADCTSLTSTPALPASVLTEHCYQYMFRGCTGLTSAPTLSSINLANYCYLSMFEGCTSLSTAPSLPATTLTTECYKNMFSGCTSLTTSPALPATTLANGCYESMFAYCNSLTTAPILSATVLVDNCYNQMFRRCSNLNYIKCLATDISASGCLTYWVERVNVTGTFVKEAGMNDWTTGDNGIPSGWTIIDAS